MEGKAWWKSAVVYQIYPASFCDSNGDGIGDINGITSKLDYLKSLGVDVVWLSPIFKTPMVDMGYDISDYRKVEPRFGSNEDVYRLIHELHCREMKLMLDLVVNHTSDQHEWFKEWKSSKTSSKRDWYIWRPAKRDLDGNRRPPNNWKASLGGGSVWEWDALTEEYYLHFFDAKMPDLNWDSPALRSAVYETMRFWLDKGVDGYRMDVIVRISKDHTFPDARITDPNSPWQEMDRSKDGPRVHEYIQEMNREVLSRYDIMTVGEMNHTRPEQMIRWVHPDRREIQMGFCFEHVNMALLAQQQKQKSDPWDRYVYGTWGLPQFKSILAKWQALRESGAWHALYLENHDLPRSISRYANDSPEWRNASGKVLAMMQCSLFGTLFLYQGEEIGMINLPDDWPLEDFPDVQTQNVAKMVQDRGDDVAQLIKKVKFRARDNARSPMQWNSENNAGFGLNTPWMRLPEDYKQCNVVAQSRDPASLLTFWRDLLKIRKAHEDILIYGDFKLLDPEDEQIFAYTRARRALVMLNFSTTTAVYTYPEKYDGARLLLDSSGSSENVQLQDGVISIPPWSGSIYLRAQ